VSCHDLDIVKPFDGYCLGHALLKVCQYVISDDKVVRGLHYASSKLPKWMGINVSHG
jgi:hypothetical protein